MKPCHSLQCRVVTHLGFPIDQNIIALARNAGAVDPTSIPRTRRDVLGCPLDLVPVLLQNDTHQLTARADSRLGKELLKCGFNGAFGDP